MDDSFPIIDSHIHLYPEAEIETLAWYFPGNPLGVQYSLDKYRAASASQKARLRGFVFLETDRISHCDDESGWKHPLEEAAWLGRIANGKPKPGQGHTPEDASLCLAIILWAPMLGGSKALEGYLSKAKESVGEPGSVRITGFRYLVHNEPRGTMLRPEFVESLKWLGRNGYCFDLGVDQRGTGIWQLDEAVEMIRQATEGVPENEQVQIVISKSICGGSSVLALGIPERYRCGHKACYRIPAIHIRMLTPRIDHMCKPDMKDVPFAPSQSSPDYPSFQEWRGRIPQLAAFKNTYMKLSGGFAEMEPLPSGEEQQSLDFYSRQRLISRTTEHVRSWMAEVLRLWGPSRCMYASDWPVTNVGGGGNDVSWPNWLAIVNTIVSPLSLEERKMIFAGTAAKAYKIPTQS